MSVVSSTGGCQKNVFAVYNIILYLKGFFGRPKITHHHSRNVFRKNYIRKLYDNPTLPVMCLSNSQNDMQIFVCMAAVYFSLSLSFRITYTPSIWSPCSGWKTSPCLQHHTTTSCYFAAVGEGRAFSNHHQMHDWCIKCNSWCIKFKGVLFTYRSYNAYPQFTSITQQVVGTEPVTCATVFDAL